ncbi:GntR family transcriptional regulator [Paenibacillus sp.]|uniref:GntR family transcriptional regulator n=1 Tax=Paenibacillus sp. TaxID=58172 RepID=UPI00281174D4|nr:GntR family transcriptional regulator [Paenibacillus sp.]
MTLSRNKRPLYLQIKNILKDRILHGVYPLDTNIPSEPRLEEEFGVSKITVRNAVKELVQEGYLEPSSGRGTRVVRNTATTKRSTWQRFTEVLVEEGHRMRKRLLGAKTIHCVEGTEPYRRFGPECLCVERLYFLDDVPYIHYFHYLPSRLANAEPSILDAQSLYEWLEEQDVALVTFRDEFAAAFAPADVAATLALEDVRAPVLKRLRYAVDASGQTVEYSEGYYNTALQHYIVKSDA